MNIARHIYYSLSPNMRMIVRRIMYYPIDLYEGITGKRNAMVPPKGMIYVGAGDFLSQGKRLTNLVVKHTGFQPDGTLLDVGCGIGRLAIALTEYISPRGQYYGFDIVKKGIEWCEKKVASRFPNFHFLHIDLKNDLYNLSTNTEAREFKFPYKADTFDTIVLTSVFTHMMPDDVQNYLHEIAKVMKADGKCFATFFILNKHSEQEMNQGKAYFNFKHTYDGYALLSRKVKEADVAYDEARLLQMIDKAGLEPVRIIYGEWCNSTDGEDFQDIVVLRRKN